MSIAEDIQANLKAHIASLRANEKWNSERAIEYLKRSIKNGTEAAEYEAELERQRSFAPADDE